MSKENMHSIRRMMRNIGEAQEQQRQVPTPVPTPRKKGESVWTEEQWRAFHQQLGAEQFRGNPKK